VAWDGLAALPARMGAWLANLGFAPIGEALASAASPSGSWAVTAGFVLGVAPLLVLGGWLVWRAGERLVEAVAAR
jgi:hypothetical protein